MSIALMYHGLYKDDADLQRITPEDRPYAVALADFESQMAALATESDLTTGFIDPAEPDIPGVIITFDDGHISNLEHALPVLQRYGMSAYFFITTGFIGQRSHFCSWEDLQLLTAAGMQIGTHGTSHRFFDDMSSVHARKELAQSREQVLNHLGISVNSLSFPGGRYNQSVLLSATELGYSQVFGSEFGKIKTDAHGRIANPIRRLPIRQGTSLSRFMQLIHADQRLFFTEIAKTQAKKLVKKTLGNQIYHGLYTTFAKRS